MKNPRDSERWTPVPCPYCGGKLELRLDGKSIRHTGFPCTRYLTATPREVTSAVIHGMS